MKLVDEQHRLPRRTQVPSGLVVHGADLFHPCSYRGQLDKSRIALPGDNRGDRGLSNSRRSPEEHRHRFPGSKSAERGPRRHQVILPDDLIQGAWSHAYGKRQAGPVGIGQAATRCGGLAADGAAEEILTHR